MQYIQLILITLTLSIASLTGSYGDHLAFAAATLLNLIMISHSSNLFHVCSGIFSGKVK